MFLIWWYRRPSRPSPSSLCFPNGGIVVVSVSQGFGVVGFWWAPFPCVFLEVGSHPVWPFKDLKHRRGGVGATSWQTCSALYGGYCCKRGGARRTETRRFREHMVAICQICSHGRMRLSYALAQYVVLSLSGGAITKRRTHSTTLYNMCFLLYSRYSSMHLATSHISDKLMEQVMKQTIFRTLCGSATASSPRIM